MKKRVFIFLFAGFVFTALAGAQYPQFKCAVIPENPRPGEPVTIGINGTAKQAVLRANGRQLARGLFFSVPVQEGEQGFMAAVLTIPSTANPGEAVIRLENETGVIIEIPLIIAGREFDADIIDLNPTLTGIRTDPSPQRTAEAVRLTAILNRTGSEIYHTGNFIPPVTSTRRTSFFGSRRVYRYSGGGTDTAIHAGVDYGVPTGTQVLACGSGKVVLATMRIVTGNSVILEHAPGIYSLYYHLDTINVQEDMIVTAGTLLGTSGSTGLATGPHLHWEIQINAENTDPDAFVARPIIDKDAILTKISIYRRAYYKTGVMLEEPQAF
jgi:murein DD-endopeptidase MepM/ murein hydrolase activator NlpD